MGLKKAAAAAAAAGEIADGFAAEFGLGVGLDDDEDTLDDGVDVI